MDSMADLLKNRPTPEEPAESKRLKDYVLNRFGVQPTVVISAQHIQLVVPNAAIAGSLRLLLPDLQKSCQLNKKLIIRIS